MRSCSPSSSMQTQPGSAKGTSGPCCVRSPLSALPVEPVCGVGAWREILDQKPSYCLLGPLNGTSVTGLRVKSPCATRQSTMQLLTSTGVQTKSRSTEQDGQEPGAVDPGKQLHRDDAGNIYGVVAALHCVRCLLLKSNEYIVVCVFQQEMFITTNNILV